MTSADDAAGGAEAQLARPATPRRLRARGAAAVAVAVAAAVALVVARPWGGSGDEKRDAAFSDPCTLFKVTELNRYVNLLPTEGGGFLAKPPPGGYQGYQPPFPAGSGMRICRFGHRTRAVEVYIGLAAAFPPDPFEKWREDNQLEPLKGLGSAWRTEQNAVVVWLGGDKVLGVKVGSPGSGHELERAKRLAADATERL